MPWNFFLFVFSFSQGQWHCSFHNPTHHPSTTNRLPQKHASSRIVKSRANNARQSPARDFYLVFLIVVYYTQCLCLNSDILRQYYYECRFTIYFHVHNLSKENTFRARKHTKNFINDWWTEIKSCWYNHLDSTIFNACHNFYKLLFQWQIINYFP